MKNYFKFLITLVVILNFPICVSGDIIHTINENKISMEEVDRLQKIKQKGTLTLVSPNEEPYSYKDPITGGFNGLDADIIREVAKRMEVENIIVRYVPLANAIEELVKNPNIDLLIQGIYITDERKQLMDFTNPIYSEKEAILTREDTEINSKEDLTNKIIGIVGGSVYVSLAENWKKQGLIKDYRPFFDDESLHIALENKIVDAMLTDSIIAENIISMKPKAKFKMLLPNKYKSEVNLSVGYPLKKGDTTLLNTINKKLQEMREDGTLYDILVKYGLADHYIP